MKTLKLFLIIALFSMRIQAMDGNKKDFIQSKIDFLLQT